MKSMGAMKSNYGKTSMQEGGLLSQADITTLKNIENKLPNLRRKMSYKKWVCADCKHESFYMVHACVFCESSGVIENSISTGVYAG